MLASRTMRRNDSTVTSRAEGHQANLDASRSACNSVRQRPAGYLLNFRLVSAGNPWARRQSRCAATAESVPERFDPMLNRGTCNDRATRGLKAQEPFIPIDHPQISGPSSPLPNSSCLRFATMRRLSLHSTGRRTHTLQALPQGFERPETGLRGAWRGNAEPRIRRRPAVSSANLGRSPSMK
jgi:hypothetical protein